ncbi:glutamyl-prolyl-tRNA synthetase [Calliopsis andreniformis]|uniref:glutamyl-prolyl-tRNA synthetase n=1 Tax=Calliopsis andreniformis TaxID=337506 RepID=UPI003FCC866A
MVYKLTVNSTNPPTDALIVAEIINTQNKEKVEIIWCNDWKGNGNVRLTDSQNKVLGERSNDVSRYFARTIHTDLYGGVNPREKTEVDHWLSFTIGPLGSLSLQESALSYLDLALMSTTWLVHKQLTLADIHVFCTLLDKEFLTKFEKKFENIHRWYKQMLSLPAVTEVLSSIKKNATMPVCKNVQSEKTVSKANGQRKQEGKFIDLPGAEMGKVVVRFPPEASGYLHIGHAKAALLNQYYAETFQGQLIMRFDDTNPAKENVEFEKAILEDLELLQIKPDRFTHSSDYFDLMLEYCTKLIKEGKAYVDDTPANIMKEQREQKLMSSNRNNSVEKNLELWNEMQRGTSKGQECCVRAKIDYQSVNGCLRDPTIYRCKLEPHPRTGTKYKVYPTYDFACPIVDAVENITHTLRTTEYHDRDDQFYWIIDALGLRRPYIWEYSRLNMTNTVLSKRKLTWFVDKGLVDGWDDPRFPTVRGILRRGMTVEGLKQFIIAQGSSRSVVFMEWDKIWSFNKKVIDPVATRYTALDYDKLIPVNIIDAKKEWLTVQNHPKDPSKGTKQVLTNSLLYIERDDANVLVEGQNTTFINWGNILIQKIEKESGVVKKVTGKLNLENKDYKNTLKITWLAIPSETDNDVGEANLVPCYAVYFDHIISKPVLGKDDDYKDFIAKDTRTEVRMLGEAELKRVKKGEIIQLQRKGFFRCDVPYALPSVFSSKERPLILFHIPDGHTTTKATSTATTAQPTCVKQSAQKNDTVQDANVINEKIIAQGDKVRDLKSKKADKATIDAEVKTLLSLKAEYKKSIGVEWKPGLVLEKSSQVVSNDSDKNKLLEDIANQESKIKELQLKINQEMQRLANLKTEYKSKTGNDWLATENQNVIQNKSLAVDELHNEIQKQGDKVRQLKGSKAEKGVIDGEVKKLLSLKADYKSATGQEWKPSSSTPASKVVNNTTVDAANKTTVNCEEISKAIQNQGDKVRQLKSSKAEKSAIDEEVKKLLSLKSDYKAATGQEWKPSSSTPAAKVVDNTVADAANKTTVNCEEISKAIQNQGDKVRQLKSSKAEKSAIDEEVKKLLSLKSDYKAATGQEWKPSSSTPAAKVVDNTVADAANKTTVNCEEISKAIQNQGDKVRQLKSSKAEKSVIDEEVKKLLSLKSDYKAATGKDWKPSPTPATTTTNTENANADQLLKNIQQQGDKVRQLKDSKADKSIIDQEVKVLLDLKSNYKTLTGQEWKPTKTDATSKKKKKEDAPKAEKQTSNKEVVKSEGPKNVDISKTGTRLGMEAKKEENFFEWYSQIITKSGMIEYYDVSGCYILRPWSFAIWKIVKEYIDKEITQMGVQECYFPIFVTRTVLEKEKAHISDFAPEVAWVTKCGDSDLAEPIAIRPTSETVMYPAYSKWLKSDTELPLKLNQWNNVVRWEFKDPKPFLRTREFLWQEGHTAFATKAEADEEVLAILDMYARVYEDLLAVPVVKGRKTEKEKFAGSNYTTTIEAFISTSGRAIQGATSHHLGQNFSKMFNIQVEGAVEGDEKTFVYQNSWGLTTRTIGVMIMVHGDDKGLVLPPNVACIQAIIVPCGITASTTAEQRDVLSAECDKLLNELSKEKALRVKADYRSNRTPGWKFNHWELKGVPVRIELGPKDLEKNQVTFVRRDTSQRITANRNEVVSALQTLLVDIQSNMLAKARQNLNEHIKQVENWDEFCSELNKKNILLSPFCGEPSCEDNIKADSAREDTGEEPGTLSMGAKSLCIPFKQPASSIPIDKLKCIYPNCQNKPKFYTLFGRSY